MSAELKEVLPKIDNIIDNASAENLFISKTECQNGIKAALDKFRRDKIMVMGLPHQNSDLIPSNNRKTESLFGTLKNIEKLYIGRDIN